MDGTRQPLTCSDTSGSNQPIPSSGDESTVGILDGKKILITGVLTDASLAFGVAKLAQEEGAEIILTGAGRGLRRSR